MSAEEQNKPASGGTPAKNAEDKKVTSTTTKPQVQTVQLYEQAIIPAKSSALAKPAIPIKTATSAKVATPAKTAAPAKLPAPAKTIVPAKSVGADTIEPQADATVKSVPTPQRGRGRRPQSQMNKPKSVNDQIVTTPQPLAGKNPRTTKPIPPAEPVLSENHVAPTITSRPQSTGTLRKSRAPNPNQKKPSVRIIPLGGLGEVGKNLTVYECQEDAFIVDCGLTFPDESMPGVDLVIPDFTYIIENKDKIKGIAITHGHEDHIGGLVFLLKKVNFPVYGTRLTIGLIEGKLKEHGLLGKVNLNVVKPRDIVKFGCMSVEYINVNHSIPDACSFAIHTPAGIIIQTGDFKIDFTPISGDIIDLARFGELGSHGVLALLSDSTNAERPGSTMSERIVGESLDKLFAQAVNQRILVATFASNVHRVQQIINASVKFGRKVAVSGRSMENVVGKAIELGYLTVPEGVIIEADAISKFPPERIVLITTGSQGEPMSALTRMSMGDHRKVTVTPNDCIIISATPIPGNEKFVSRVINELMKLGATVIYEKMYDIHVSGHACQDELKMIMALTKPKFFVPVHGEFKHLKKHAELAQSMGIDPKNIIIGDIGKVIETDGLTMKFNGTVQAGKVLVDGLGVGDVGSIVLRDRKHLAQDGLIIVVTTINTQSGQILAGPDIVSRGFVYVRESEGMIDRARIIARDAVQDCMDKNTREWGVLKQRIKDDVGDYVWQTTKRNPMILPVIQEV